MQKVTIKEAINIVENKSYIVICFENGYKVEGPTYKAMEDFHGYGYHDNEIYKWHLKRGIAQEHILVQSDQYTFRHATNLIKSGEWTSILLQDGKNPLGQHIPIKLENLDLEIQNYEASLQ